MRAYSPFLATVYDEPAPVGLIGAGTHYSVLRALRLPWGHVNATPEYIDVAVVWDADHDERVISVLEGLYVAGVLTHVLAVGERKGFFYVLVEDDLPVPAVQQLGRDVDAVLERVPTNDVWTGSIHRYMGATISGLVVDEPDRVGRYFAALRVLWDLGRKSIAAPTRTYSSVATSFPPYCGNMSGADDATAGWICDLDPGHDGDHGCADRSWPRSPLDPPSIGHVHGALRWLDGRPRRRPT